MFAMAGRDLLRDSGVPLPEQSRDIELIPSWLPGGYRALVIRAMQLLDDPKIVAVGGPRGTGKSTIAWGLAVKFCDCARPAIYRTVGEFFHELGNAAWEDKQRIRDALATPDLLVLDEVQVRDTDRQWQDNELTTLIDRRYREQKATLLLSNLTPESLQQNLGDSAWRRLVETGGPPIEADWENIHECRQRHVEQTVGGKK